MPLLFLVTQTTVRGLMHKAPATAKTDKENGKQRRQK